LGKKLKKEKNYQVCITSLKKGEKKLSREKGSPSQASQLKRMFMWEKVDPFAQAKS